MSDDAEDLLEFVVTGVLLDLRCVCNELTVSSSLSSSLLSSSLETA